MLSSTTRAVLLLATVVTTAVAAPVRYNVDPAHTYPSFEADHMGGLSVFRGKFNTTSGTITLDSEAQTGTIDVKVDAASIDFGNEKLNTEVKGPQMFDTARFPDATYTGKLTSFKNGSPTEADGTLKLHGVSKPVTLKINKFVCKPSPMTKKEVCGADATAKINREDFGVSYGKAYGFNMDVVLQIQIEAVKAD